MAKYHGNIGFRVVSEDPPDSGIWKETIAKKEYSGTVLDDTRRVVVTTDSVNPDLNITARISIVANKYAMENFHSIRYAEYLGAKWNVISAQPSFPRIILNLGGLYNGQDENESSGTSENSDS